MMDVKKLAQFARIELSESETEAYEKELKEILDMLETMPQIEKEENFLDETNPMKLRKDEIKPSLKRDLLMQNAPKAIAGCIVVPKVVD